jgi:DNA polymerase III sliding clamp (beta) subunit (PCNA family)
METKNMLNAVELDFDFGITEKKLMDIAKKMLVTVSNDARTGCLQAMQLIRKDNQVTAYSTDKHRLSGYTFESQGQDYNVLIYKDYIKELKKTGKLESYKVMSEADETRGYPKCEALIPSFTDTIQINDVKGLIKDIKYYRNKNHTLVKINLSDATVALDSYAGDFTQVVKADVELVNFTREQLVENYLSDLLVTDLIAFNINYFVDALKAVGSDTIQVSTNLQRPLGLKRFQNPDDKEFSVYMMPVQLRN